MRKSNASKAISAESLEPRKRKGKTYWYAQWRENGSPRSKEIGLCSAMTRAEAEGILSEILQPINAAAGSKQVPVLKHTFGQFVEKVYLPVSTGRWKLSTAMTEVDRIKYHLIQPLGGQAIRDITREEMQTLLNQKAENLSASVISHLRFRLRSIFALTLSEGVVDRNPAVTLYTPVIVNPAVKRGFSRPTNSCGCSRSSISATRLSFDSPRSKACARVRSWP